MSDVPRGWFITLISSLALAIFAFTGSCIHLWLTSSSEIAKLRAKMIILGAAISQSSTSPMHCRTRFFVSILFKLHY
jgi:hypothetical protein